MSRVQLVVGMALVATIVGQARGDPVVVHFNPNYAEGTHYRVWHEPGDPPRIEIIQSIPGETFDFYCCQEGGTVPADLQAITVDENPGEARVKLSGHYGWDVGADNVGQIVLNWGQGVCGHVEGLEIQGHPETTQLADHARPTCHEGAIPIPAPRIRWGAGIGMSPSARDCAAARADISVGQLAGGVSHGSIVYDVVCARLRAMPG